MSESSNLMKKVGREKQLITDLLNRKDEELKNIGTEHEGKLEKLRVQLLTAKESKDSNSPSSFGAEFYRKKILAMQKHYENQIHELMTSSHPAISPSKSVKSSPSKTPANVSEVPSTSKDIPNVTKIDKMAAAAGARSSLRDRFKSKTPAMSSETQNTAMNNTAEPALKKKKVSFKLSSFQTAKLEKKEKNEEFEFKENFHTPTTSRNKRRGNFQTPSKVSSSSSSTTQSGSGAAGKSGGEPLNEDFWTSISAEKDSSPFSDVFFSRVSPKKTQNLTQSSYSSHVTTPTPFHQPLTQSSSGRNCSGPAKSKTPARFKFTDIPETQVISIKRTQYSGWQQKDVFKASNLVLNLMPHEWAKKDMYSHIAFVIPTTLNEVYVQMKLKYIRESPVTLV